MHTLPGSDRPDNSPFPGGEHQVRHHGRQLQSQDDAQLAGPGAGRGVQRVPASQVREIPALVLELAEQLAGLAVRRHHDLAEPSTGQAIALGGKGVGQASPHQVILEFAACHLVFQSRLELLYRQALPVQPALGLRGTCQAGPASEVVGGLLQFTVADGQPRARAAASVIFSSRVATRSGRSWPWRFRVARNSCSVSAVPAAGAVARGAVSTMALP